MTNPEIYGWQSVCVRAILETDDLLITGRIYEAIAAIEQRRLSPGLKVIAMRTVL